MNIKRHLMRNSELREEFEEWFNEEMVLHISASNATVVRLMWKAWQASRMNSPWKQNFWVPCIERMPADSQTVLCGNLLTDLSGIPFIADYVVKFSLHDGTEYETGFYIGRTAQMVTHWQPLPSMPTWSTK
ncbi:DUF551 domain-containing protein [Serratia liquefaciens]|uniref:DUF551 domain-containing protein n=1 Tax=Serratia liquefaciens TaxID=614 RepID=A0A515CRE8_SERLI|nr:DUF551 domain-containing protein [Serratia liquefaciens]QDL30736.1 DUF551 domain-containing protein [Serratia liquefaciens]